MDNNNLTSLVNLHARITAQEQVAIHTSITTANNTGHPVVPPQHPAPPPSPLPAVEAVGSRDQVMTDTITGYWSDPNFACAVDRITSIAKSDGMEKAKARAMLGWVQCKYLLIT
jgi:hypothetical protein